MTGSQRPGAAVRIAVDLLGGDDAPAAVVDGALSALNADADLQLHLVGPREVADQVRSACADPSRVQVVPADS
ncbi:MAG: phosphate acyltransferase PlsX, partial [Micromonosporaceae bacterium]|nr:phosphate acyltransferase PlsX [Micromonosporaceae bacterium]